MIIEILLIVLIVLTALVVGLTVRMARVSNAVQLEIIEKLHFQAEGKLLNELDRLRQGFNQTINQSSQGLREEVLQTISRFSDSIQKQMTAMLELQNSQYENIRKTVDVNLRVLREENSRKLEEMRLTVDEKLHSTLEKRLGEAFRQVGDRLERVHQGLGEMQNLASGVGDLKRVLTNVKTRGTLGEIQLERQLMQLLSPQQYEKNVCTKKKSRNFVEFAIKLPGQGEGNESIWLPIDSKFPMNTFEQLNLAYDRGVKEEIDKLTRTLGDEIKRFARDIRDKYISPPETTDFGIMYLPTEGLYAEVLRIDGLFEELVRAHRVVPVGPTTFAAFINSLQMGFRTLTIEKRSSEVWQLLGKVKTEFSKFGELLEKTRKKLDEAGKSIDDATQRSKSIERRLDKIEELPEDESLPGLNARLPELD